MGTDSRMTRATTWDELPLVMHVEDVARLTGLNVSSIYKRCQKRKKTAGGPVSWSDRPYEWSREVARAHYERGGQVPKPRGRRQPFEGVTDLRESRRQLMREALASRSNG
jgi:hypothetical protein